MIVLVLICTFEKYRRKYFKIGFFIWNRKIRYLNREKNTAQRPVISYFNDNDDNSKVNTQYN